MIASKTKTVVLIIGVIIAFLLLFQPFGIRINNGGRLHYAPVNLELTTVSEKAIDLVKKINATLHMK